MIVMGNKKFVSFKEQMKKILIFYSLIPIIFTALIGYGMIYYLSYRAMVNNNNNNLKNSLIRVLSYLECIIEKARNKSPNL